jgi:hypothetical protein
MKNKNVAFFWDESFLWGLMAYKAFTGLNLPFDLIRAEDIRTGVLENYRMLFVPGGWASNKTRALGESGIEAIQTFVAQGGSYLGFCGGAGLATQAKGGGGLLNVKRRPTKERVPSFSGEIKLTLNSCPLWGSVNDTLRTTDNGQRVKVFHAWWPSQFIIDDEHIKILATYGDALPGAFSSDLNVGDVEAGGSWKEQEEMYQINLDPRRLEGEPAVLEGTYGKGKVILSLVHFDTPGDVNGEQVLVNLWKYLAGQSTGKITGEKDRVSDTVKNKKAESDIYALCAGLISLGERNFLWFWRNSMLLQWRRGVRGLEYNTLYIMVKEIADLLRENPSPGIQSINKGLSDIKELIVPFVEKSGKLLVMERYELQKGNHITYEKCDVAEIRELRTELFSGSKSHGGMFKELIDRIDEVLFGLLINRGEL